MPAKAKSRGAVSVKRGRARGRVNPSDWQAGRDAGFAGRDSSAALKEHIAFARREKLEDHRPPLSAGELKILKQRFRKAYKDGQVESGHGRKNPRGARPGKYTAKDLVGIGKTAVTAKLAPWALLNKGKKKNPRSRKNHHNEKAAVDAFRQFHGREPEELIEFESVHHFPGRTSAIGDLVSLSIRVPQERFPGDSARERTVDLSDFGDAWLTEHPTMKQLYVEGGDQSIDLEQFGLDESEPHELEYLGELMRCEYFTRKDHLGSEGGEANYHHKFGKNELTLKKTELIKVAYHVPDEQLIFAGGGYEIPAEGIDG